MAKAVIVGGGFAGCTAACMLKEKHFDVTVIEASGVLGGGCRTYFYHGHPYTFGPHHLLINIEDTNVYDYFSKFLTLRELRHHCLTYVSEDDRFYTYPIHADEIKEMPDKDIIYGEIEKGRNAGTPENFEQYWINSVGNTLYDKFINTYSKKMWQIKNNKMIDEFAFSPKGLPLKEGSKQCFEGKKIVAYPVELDGFNSYFDRCVEGCKVLLNSPVTRFDIDQRGVIVNDELIRGDILINTASIDQVFDYMYGELKYIGRALLKVILPVERVTPEPYYFIHYAGDEPYTRIVEYKLLTGYQSPDTLIGIEFPSTENKLYPYPLKSEIEKAKRYIGQLPQNVYTLGRLGKYHYDNMDIIVKDCMELMKVI
ncbi:MAG: NAD(P)-binding protein [Nitrospirae bacterium]|nr:NAD(P)-binding protein [Nitrospirota bacterium]